jgi:hypothetical protein
MFGMLILLFLHYPQQRLNQAREYFDLRSPAFAVRAITFVATMGSLGCELISVRFDRGAAGGLLNYFNRILSMT